LKITRDPRFRGADQITGQLVDQSSPGRALVPFTSSTHDFHFTDPVHLDAILAALETQLVAGPSHITLVYPERRGT
jgi:hypothetical protein